MVLELQDEKYKSEYEILALLTTLIPIFLTIFLFAAGVFVNVQGITVLSLNTTRLNYTQPCGSYNSIRIENSCLLNEQNMVYLPFYDVIYFVILEVIMFTLLNVTFLMLAKYSESMRPLFLVFLSVFIIAELLYISNINLFVESNSSIGNVFSLHANWVILYDILIYIPSSITIIKVVIDWFIYSKQDKPHNSDQHNKIRVTAFSRERVITIKNNFTFSNAILLLFAIAGVGVLITAVLTYSNSTGINYNALVAFGTISLALGTGITTLWGVYDRIATKAREHYEALKEYCLRGISKELHSYYFNTFIYSNISEAGGSAYNKANYYYQDKMIVNKIPYPRKYIFSFLRAGSEVDQNYYNDLSNHFAGLKERLDSAEKFIDINKEEVVKYEKEIFDIISNDSEFRELISHITSKVNISEQQIIPYFLAFSLNAIFTKDKNQSALLNGMVFNFGGTDGVDKCYIIAMKYSDIEPVYKLKEIETKASRELLTLIEDLNLLLRKIILGGTCPYVS